MRGQCNIYSDITFHFYEAGKSCRSRKRAARDIPAWEATVALRTARSSPGQPGQEAPPDPWTPLKLHMAGTAPGSSASLSLVSLPQGSQGVCQGGRDPLQVPCALGCQPGAHRTTSSFKEPTGDQAHGAGNCNRNA